MPTQGPPGAVFVPPLVSEKRHTAGRFTRIHKKKGGPGGPWASPFNNLQHRHNRHIYPHLSLISVFFFSFQVLSIHAGSCL